MSAAFGRVRTGCCDQQGLLFAGDLAVGSRVRPLSGPPVADHEAALSDRTVEPPTRTLLAILVTGAGIRSQQNLRALHPRGGGGPRSVWLSSTR
jgi:hypothetical protein